MSSEGRRPGSRSCAKIGERVVNAGVNHRVSAESAWARIILNRTGNRMMNGHGWSSSLVRRDVVHAVQGYRADRGHWG